MHDYFAYPHITRILWVAPAEIVPAMLESVMDIIEPTIWKNYIARGAGGRLMIILNTVPNSFRIHFTYLKATIAVKKLFTQKTSGRLNTFLIQPTNL